MVTGSWKRRRAGQAAHAKTSEVTEGLPGCTERPISGSRSYAGDPGQGWQQQQQGGLLMHGQAGQAVNVPAGATHRGVGWTASFLLTSGVQQ